MDYAKEFFFRMETRTGSIYRLCLLAHLDQSNISKMKSGRKEVSLETVVKVCEALGIDPWEEIPAWVTHRAPSVSPLPPGVLRSTRLLELARQSESAQSRD